MTGISSGSLHVVAGALESVRPSPNTYGRAPNGCGVARARLHQHRLNSCAHGRHASVRPCTRRERRTAPSLPDCWETPNLTCSCGRVCWRVTHSHGGCATSGDGTRAVVRRSALPFARAARAVAVVETRDGNKQNMYGSPVPAAKSSLCPLSPRVTRGRPDD